MEQKPVLSQFGDSRFSRRVQGDDCLVIDVRVTLVQLLCQAFGFFLLEKLRPGSDLSTDGGLPINSVRFLKTIGAFSSTGCAMRRMLITMHSWQVVYGQSGFLNRPGEGPAPLQFGLMRPRTSCILRLRSLHRSEGTAPSTRNDVCAKRSIRLLVQGDVIRAFELNDVIAFGLVFVMSCDFLVAHCPANHGGSRSCSQ